MGRILHVDLDHIFARGGRTTVFKLADFFQAVSKRLVFARVDFIHGYVCYNGCLHYALEPMELLVIGLYWVFDRDRRYRHFCKTKKGSLEAPFITFTDCNRFNVWRRGLFCDFQYIGFKCYAKTRENHRPEFSTFIRDFQCVSRGGSKATSGNSCRFAISKIRVGPRIY